MENPLFSFEPFECDLHCPLIGYVEDDGVTKGRQSNSSMLQYWEDFDNIAYESGHLQDDTMANGDILSRDWEQPFSDFGMFNELPFDAISTPVQPFPESSQPNAVQSGVQEVSKFQKEKQIPFSLTSLRLLSNCRSGLKMLNCEKLTVPRNETTCSTKASRRLSTAEMMKFAAARYIQLSDDDFLATGQHPHFPFLDFSEPERRELELAILLQASADSVGNKQFEHASKLINQCLHLSSETGNPVQRVVYYFARALHNRIDRESGRMTPMPSKTNEIWEADFEEKAISPHPAILACFQNLPFVKMLQFTGIQAIFEKIASHKKVHIIDLGIRMGAHWIILMQALAVAEPIQIELLKITCVGTMDRQQNIEKTGNRLANFAKTLNIPLSFKLVMVSDMKDLKEDLFDIDPDEAVAVYASCSLRSMVPRPDRLKTLMRVIRKLKPVTMVIIEVEAYHNSTSFINRFMEALFFNSAFFDCLDACMDPRDPNRMIVEGMYFNEGIQSMIVCEADKRLNRNLNINVWRAFFARYGMVETELSQSALYQASLVLEQFTSGSSCTIEMNGKSLIAGWKGTPLYSLSVWKFR